MRSKIHLWRLSISASSRVSKNFRIASLTNLALPEKSFFAKLFTKNECVEEILQFVADKQIWTKNIRLASVYVNGKQWPKR